MDENWKEKQHVQSEWIITIAEELQKARLDNEAIFSRKPCIYKVPRYLREADKKSYTPSVVSIGPYHYQNIHLHPMERHKWRAFYQTINRHNHDDFKLYLEAIKHLEAKARDSYESEINLNSNEFVKMMVLDGCFILELFRGIKDGFEELGYSKGDPVFSICGFLDSIRRDMIKLENQIPLFILDKLLALQSPDCHDKDKDALVNMAIPFFAPLIPTDEPMRKGGAFTHFDVQPLHCLQLFRENLVSKGLILPKRTKKLWKRRLSRNVVGKPTTQITYCVSQLRENGVRFRKRETDQFWDIKYKNSILEIPRILIHDGTKSIFRNLVAFEECHPECSNEITAYLVFMNNLIDSGEDVSYLNYKGIIEHWLGNNDDVADLFNGLCQEVVADLNNSYLSGLTDEINKCRDKRWTTWKADFRHKYFRNPWALISVIAAVVLLLITVMQTFYDIFSYYKP